ncbi:hypothetical protein Ndes2437B_g08847 [Nannochloris sp. 'desiccata']
MQRTPLLKAIDGASPRCNAGTSPRTPSSWSSPGSPSVDAKSLDNVLKLVVGFTGLMFLAFLGVIACIFTSGGSESVSRAFGATTIQWGPEAATYQSCRSDTTTLPNLLPVQRWSSKKVVPAESITAVTHISLDSLSALRSQCTSWSDRLAAVVYVPYIQGFGAVSTGGVAAINGSSISSVINVLAMLHQETEQVHTQDGCALELELIVEEFPKNSWDDANLWRYPGNALRNRALLLVGEIDVDLVLLLDKDQVPESTLPKSYQNRPKTFSTFVRRLIKQRTAIVLPTLTPISSGTTGSYQSVRQLVDQVVAGGKEHAVAAWRRLDLGVVDFDGNLNTWASAKKGNFEAVDYKHGSHPALILPRIFVPFYDERFRGEDFDFEGKDRALHVAYLTHGLGITLEVHPETFVVHETPQEMRRRQNSGSGSLENASWQESIYTAALEEIQYGTYVPVTSFATWCPRTENGSGRSLSASWSLMSAAPLSFLKGSGKSTRHITSNRKISYIYINKS